MTADVIDPPHYTRLDPEPIDVIAAWGLTFDIGNVVKYCVRAGHKPGAAAVVDLAKARRYLDHAIEQLEAEQAVTAGLVELASAPTVAVGRAAIDARFDCTPDGE